VIENIFNLASPKWKLQRRGNYSRLRGYLFRILAVVLALLIAAWAIELTGESAIDMAKNLLDVTFKSSFGRKQLLLLSTPLIINGAAMMLSVRMQLFNFGLEGQLFMGAFAATAIGLNVDGPPAVVLPLMALGAILAGALYAAIPAILRIKVGVSEILSTLLLNPLAIQFAAYIGMDAWRDNSVTGATSNATVPITYEFPIIGEVNIGFIIAVLIVIGLWLAISKRPGGMKSLRLERTEKPQNIAGCA
jgi:general nucleoside transport system permease protein